MKKRESFNQGKHEEDGGMSRRSFLKYGGLFAGATAVSVGAAGLTGCSSGNPGTSGSGTTQTSADLPEYEVFDTDMIIIGAGFGAMSACDEAVRQGKQVMVIDKGPYGFGGACGMNWDICYTWSPFGTDAKDVYYSTRTTSRQLYVNAATSDPYKPNDYVPIINWGEVCPQRNADGTIRKKLDYPTMGMVEWGFPRHMLDHFAQKDNLTIHDLTMITDVFISDGVCVGAIGIYLPTGSYRVYRSKATLLATGGCTGMYGWVTLSSVTNNTPDNTADVEMAVFRHGGRIGDSEHAAYDMMGIVPSGWASSEGSMFGGDSMDIAFMLDKDGVAFCLDESLDQDRMVLDRPYFNQVVAKVIMEGRGGPNGGIFLPATDEMREQMRYMYLRCVNLIEDKTGIDLRTEPMECLIEMYEHGGTPAIDDNMMSTEFPGLFCVRGAGVAGEAGGSTNNRNRVLGGYTLRCALDYLDSYKESEKLDWSGVEDEIKRLEDLRTREISGGQRPVEIQRKIQETSYNALGVIRTTENLEAARTELKRILDEDIPKMTVSSHTRTYNRDWKDAIETINMLELARLSVEATYIRPESRGNFFRPDYPEQNDTDWGCMLALYDAGNGEFAYDKVTYPDVAFPA